ncbi:MAG: hypothetical protein ABI367_16485 [Mucilaginibacter sp.]
MKKYINLIKTLKLLTFIGASWCLNSSAQVLTDIQQKFNTYNQNTLQEKLFVHTDKSFYLAGEIIWFKIYDISEAQNKLVDASKVAYVEILDKNNAPILQGKINLENGTGNGSFYIPVSATSGNYKLRAYTNWMKNFSADKYFEKNITIINSQKEITLQTKEPVVADYDVQFFPEGGNLVSGLNSKIAYRAVGADGKGIDFTGAIVNRANDTIVRFKPHKFGIGTFIFKPEATNAYRAVLKVNGKTITKLLPAIAANGFAMQLSDAGTQLKVNISATTNNTGSVYLIAHTRQLITTAKTIDLTNGEGSFLIDKNKLGEGVTHITIFNGDKQPVCERLYFIRPKQKLAIDAAPDKSEYSTRKNVSVSVAAKNIGNTEGANLSMAVYRLDSLETSTPESIYTYIWLTSELKGNIESPEYYLNGTDDEAVDNLLLTHGWSKYNWNEVMQTQPAALKYLPEYDGHIITGKITNPKTTLSVPNNEVVMGVPGRRVQLYNSISDADGNFIFNTKNFIGPNEIVVQPRLEQDTLLKTQILNPFSEQYSSTPVSELVLPKQLYNSLQIHNLGMQVQNTFSGEKLKQQYTPLIDTTSSFNGAQIEYLTDNYTRFTTMEEVMREYIHEVLVSKPGGNFRFRVINQQYYMEKQPELIFDGVPIYNANTIIASDPLKVRKIDVVPAEYHKGKTAEYGLISYSTYKGDMGGVEINPHSLVIDYEGLQLNRDFFSPVYETEKQSASHLPDFRTVLYWAPDIYTDANGKANVNFYTSDQPGKYLGVVQGISASGKAGMQTFSFDVKPMVTP